MKDPVLETSEALNGRGIRGSLVVYRGSFYWRGVYTDASGKWDYPDSVDRCQGSTCESVRVLMNCCS